MHIVGGGGCNFWQDVVLYEKRSLLMPLDRSGQKISLVNSANSDPRRVGARVNTVRNERSERSANFIRHGFARGLRGNGRRSHRPHLDRRNKYG